MTETDSVSVFGNFGFVETVKPLSDSVLVSAETKVLFRYLTETYKILIFSSFSAIWGDFFKAVIFPAKIYSNHTQHLFLGVCFGIFESKGSCLPPLISCIILIGTIVSVSVSVSVSGYQFRFRYQFQFRPKQKYLFGIGFGRKEKWLFR